MEPDILERIGSKVGHVEELDRDEGGISLGKTIRLRVRRRIDVPLVRCVTVNKEGGEEETFVIIQYEKLPHFCFACGRIGHIIKDCEDDKVDKTNLRFDHRLRASTSLNPQAHRFWGGGGSRSWGEFKDKGVARLNRELGIVAREAAEKEGESDREVLGEEEEEEDDRQRGVGEGDEEVGEKEEVVLGDGTSGLLRLGEGDGGMEGKVGGNVMISPSKKKKETGGRGWKKRAREVVVVAEKVGGAEKGMVLEKGGKKRGGLEVEEEDQTPAKRLERVDSITLSFDSITAEAAAQPRRIQ